MSFSTARRVVRASLASAGVALLGSTAMGAGPDITHQDLTDTAHYGPVGGVHGYAWGSGTCNIGDQNLSWINGGTPILAMNAYRLHDGQLLQIGIGHGKTACCVGNGSGCGLTCTTTGTGLRAGCRDFYSAGFNGGQTRLGPRSGVNPFSGMMQTIPAGTGDAIFRHVQIRDTDMNPTNFPGALYFAEGEYVCTEESPSAKLNNATWRRCTIANTGTAPTYTWSVADTSQVGVPAIFAWRVHGLGLNQADNSVLIVPADVPGEGRFYVAGKARDLGNGQWRYEYAVFNLDSHVSGASLTVPLPAAGSMSDVGFHDINYHSGEPYNNTDWASSRSGDAVTWAGTETFAQNPNGNALRWGTMYNFWYTTNLAPAATTGSVTLGLFRPYTYNGETVSSITVPGLPVPTGGSCMNPQITAQPGPTIMCPRGNATISVGIAPGGPFTYQWQRPNPDNLSQVLTLADGPAPWNNNAIISGATTSSLHISNLSAKEGGVNAQYTLTISSPCGTVISSPAPLLVCRADYNCGGGVSVQDVFDFVGGYFAAEPRADINADGVITTQDIFDFVGSYFGGC